MSSWKPCYDVHLMVGEGGQVLTLWAQVANEKPTQHKLICWDEDISLALMLYPVDLKRMVSLSS